MAKHHFCHVKIKFTNGRTDDEQWAQSIARASVVSDWMTDWLSSSGMSCAFDSLFPFAHSIHPSIRGGSTRPFVTAADHQSIDRCGIYEKFGRKSRIRKMWKFHRLPPPPLSLCFFFYSHDHLRRRRRRRRWFVELKGTYATNRCR